MILGLSGLKRCGKDTAADYLKRKYPKLETVMWAEPIKEGLKAMFGFTDEQVNGLNGYDREEPTRYGPSIRQLLQTLGTDWGRHMVNPDIWVLLQAEKMDPNKFYIVTDVRFLNEAELCRQNGALLHIVNPQEERTADTHESEAGVAFAEGDHIIINNKDGLDKYYQAIDDKLAEIARANAWDLESYL